MNRDDDSMIDAVLHDHMTAKLSDLDMEMVRSIPPGGNWKDIPPETVAKSRRLQQIHASGGRTTYYGRLRYDRPSYTISTYFSRPGNGCYIHPEQDRLISLREAARLQSFPDSFLFSGSRTSKYKQIGNAIPPLMAKVVSEMFSGSTAIDLFAGAGGLSWGLHKAGFNTLLAVDFDERMCETLRLNDCAKSVLNMDLTEQKSIDYVCETAENHLKGKQLDLCAGGPPCQGFSTAGNWDRTDPRNNLFKPFLEIVRRMEPAAVLIENVPGIKSMLKGEILRKIVSLLDEMGYAPRTSSLKSEAYGAPQRRRRVFIYGSRNDKELFLPDSIFGTIDRNQMSFSRNGDLGLLPGPLTVGDALSELPSLEHGGGTEVIHYDATWPESDYQRWLRGQIGLDDMLRLYQNRAERE